jgi:hypothetical protein
MELTHPGAARPREVFSRLHLRATPPREEFSWKFPMPLCGATTYENDSSSSSAFFEDEHENDSL